MPRSLSRALAVTVALAAAWLAATGVFGDRGLLAVHTLRTEARQVEARNEELAAENRRLSEHVRRLRSDDAAIERIAREEHGFLREGEVIYQFDEDEGQGGE